MSRSDGFALLHGLILVMWGLEASVLLSELEIVGHSLLGTMLAGSQNLRCHVACRSNLHPKRGLVLAVVLFRLSGSGHELALATCMVLKPEAVAWFAAWKV